MNWRLAFNGAVAGAALLVAACGGYGTSAYGSASSSSSNGRYPGVTSPPAGTPEPPAAVATVALRDTPLGQILVDGKGRTLYLFEADKTSMSTCYGDCAAVWPPLVATGTPVAGAGVNQSLLTTAIRKDGSLEVVYNGHPLYYFVSDRQPGDTTGQALNSFGAGWDVLSATGTKVEKG